MGKFGFSSRRQKRRPKRGRLADILLTLVFFLAIVLAVTWLDDQSGEVLSGRAFAVDGDSLVMGERRLRLRGIDAPELTQMCEKQKRPWACGRASRAALRKMISSSDVTCRTSGEDRYQRLLVVCTAREQELNAMLVRQGWAVNYGGYGKEEAEAKRLKAGIWNSVFENPQEWRRDNRGAANGVSELGTKTIKTWIKNLMNRNSHQDKK